MTSGGTVLLVEVVAGPLTGAVGVAEHDHLLGVAQPRRRLVDGHRPQRHLPLGQHRGDVPAGRGDGEAQLADLLVAGQRGVDHPADLRRRPAGHVAQRAQRLQHGGAAGRGLGVEHQRGAHVLGQHGRVVPDGGRDGELRGVGRAVLLGVGQVQAEGRRLGLGEPVAEVLGVGHVGVGATGGVGDALQLLRPGRVDLETDGVDGDREALRGQPLGHLARWGAGALPVGDQHDRRRPVAAGAQIVGCRLQRLRGGRAAVRAQRPHLGAHRARVAHADRGVQPAGAAVAAVGRVGAHADPAAQRQCVQQLQQRGLGALDLRRPGRVRIGHGPRRVDHQHHRLADRLCRRRGRGQGAGRLRWRDEGQQQHGEG